MKTLPPLTRVEAVAKLGRGENHPEALNAAAWLTSIGEDSVLAVRAALEREAADGDYSAHLCLTTLERVLTGRPVADRYLLALCWRLKRKAEQ